MKQLSLVFILAVLLSGLSAKAQTFTTITLQSGTLVSAPSGNLQPGALYKYPNAAGGSGNLIDAYVQILRKSNTGSNYVGLYAFDNLANVNNPGGYDYAFQPVTSCSNVNTSGLWTPSQHCGQGTVEMSHTANQDYLVHFRLYFKKAGTALDTALNFYAAFIDMDGFGSGTEAEQNAFMPGQSYSVSPNTTLSFKTRSDGLICAEGDPANVAGLQLTAITAISQVVYLNRSYVDFAMGMNTHTGTLNGSCYDAVAGGRLASVSFATQPVGCTITTNTTINLSGTVWDDADGSANNTFTNIKTNTETGTAGGGLYVYALDSLSGTVLKRAAVNANGTWSMTNIAKNVPIVLVLSKTLVNEGVTNGRPTGVLNSGWVATSPLTRPSFRPAITTANLDFGIEQPPVGANYTVPSQLNPGSTITDPVPTYVFTGNDPEDGVYTTGLSGEKVTLTPGVNGDLYYNGTKITTTTTYPSFDPTKLTLDPTGLTPLAQSRDTATFTYAVYDNANVPSVPKTITMLFEPPLLISGYVWDDANGDAIKATTEPYTNGGGVNAVLTNAGGLVLQVVAVNATTGFYQFDQSISNNTYKVVLTTTTPTPGVTTLTTSSLPNGVNGPWVNTGVNLNNVPNTGNMTAVITVAIQNAPVTNQNFGIEQIPAGSNYTVPSQLNPGGTTTVPVPTVVFTGNDPEDGTYPTGLSGKKITLTPGVNGDLYYNGTKITTTTTYTSFDPTKLTLDPTGLTPLAQSRDTATFTYSVYDNANVPSVPKTITMLFEPPVPISGYVWDDANANAIKATTEPFTNAGGLNAALTDATGLVLQYVAVNATTGAYQFDRAISNTVYKVVLTTTTPTPGVTTLTTSSLPNGTNGPWVNTGVNLNNVPNTGNKTGIISFTTGTMAIIDQNFGIQQPPAGANYTAGSRLNPGDTITVSIPSAAFTGNDPEDGTYTTGLTGKKVTITPGSNGDLYYNGVKITTATTYTSFDPTRLRIDPTGPQPKAFVAVTSTFTYSVYDAGNLPSAAKTVTVPFDAALCIRPRVYLEGALINNGGAVASDGRPLMRDNIRNSPFTAKNYIPVKDIYETPTAFINITAKYTKLSPQTAQYPQFQQVTDSATVFGVTGQNAIVDWAFVELRSKSNNAVVSATRAGLLQRDGDIVETDGVGCLLFPGIAIDSYYVAVRHRTHLGTMTKYAQSSTNLNTLVDLTVATTPLYDKGLVGVNNFSGLSQKAGVSGTYRAMWQGDFNQDGKVKYDNPNDDLGVMLSEAVNYPGNNDFATNFDFAYGYRQGDYNMDSKVKYDNPNDDNARLLSQEVNYILNTDLATNFDFLLQQLP